MAALGRLGAGWMSARAGRISALALVVLAGRGFGQGGSDTVYHVHGRVMDGVTHRPIARALVASNDRRLAAMTDREGNFAIDVSVPAGGGGSSTYVGLTAQRPGYSQVRQSTPMLLQNGANPPDVALQLMPEASIYGTVVADGADRASRVPVVLLLHQVSEGLPTWQQVAQMQTDALGAFRFANLQPGEYTVMSTEWAGDDPSYLQKSRQYPPRFLGEAATLAGAAKLHLKYGGSEQAALRLRPADYYPVRVPVQGLPDNTGVNVRVEADGVSLGYSLGWNGRDRAVEGALPSGNYVLRLASFGPQRGSVQVPLGVGDAPVMHAPVALAEGGAIPVRVHLQFTEADKPAELTGLVVGGGPGQIPTAENPVQLYLQSAEVGGGGGNSRRQAVGADLLIEDVAPGRYNVHAATARGYVASVDAGGVDLLRQPLVVGDGGGADPIDVVVRNDGATVSGEVDFGEGNTPANPGEPSPQNYCALLLVSADGSARVATSYAQQGKRFRVPNVAPGTYRAFALEQMEAQRLPYRDVAAMHAFDALGTPVTVAANGTAELKLKLVSLAQAGQGE